MIQSQFIQCKDDNIKAFIEYKVKQTNKNCPVQIVNGMTMDKSEAEGDNTIKYYYTVPKHILTENNSDNEIKATMVSSLRSSLKFEKIKDYGITYHYVFYDVDKNLLGEIKIEPENYKIIYE